LTLITEGVDYRMIKQGIDKLKFKFKFKFNWKNELRDTALITIGSAVCGIAYVMFLAPHQVVSGGVGGISIMLNYLFKWPISLFYIALNVPIFILGLKGMGTRYALKSLAGILLVSGFIFLFESIIQLPSATGDHLLGSIFGGIVLGLGLGIVFRGNGSTGGTDIIAQFLNKHTNISVGGWIMIIDLVVIGSSGFVFKDLEAPLYGIMALIISSFVLNMILEGFSYARTAHIITVNPQEISWAIALELRRGVTTLKGHSYFTGKDRDVLYIVLTRKEIPRLKAIVKQVDPNAFVVISDAYEVLGKGFKPRV